MEDMAEGVRRTRTVRTGAVLRGHKASTTLKGHCVCGFRVPAGESIEDHQSRMVCAELFHTTPAEVKTVATGLTAGLLHPGGAENLAMHRALGEPPCMACLRFLDEVMDEGRTRRMNV